MGKKMLIDAAHPEETRVVVAHGNRIEEFDFESAAKKQLRGSIYLAKVTRVEPSLQAAFVEYGGNRHGFLAFSEIHPDYYQIPVADRQALLEEEAAEARRAEEMEEEDSRPRRSRRDSNRDGGDRDNGGRRRPRRGGTRRGMRRRRNRPEEIGQDGSRRLRADSLEPPRDVDAFSVAGGLPGDDRSAIDTSGRADGEAGAQTGSLRFSEAELPPSGETLPALMPAPENQDLPEGTVLVQTDEPEDGQTGLAASWSEAPAPDGADTAAYLTTGPADPASNRPLLSDPMPAIAVALPDDLQNGESDENSAGDNSTDGDDEDRTDGRRDRNRRGRSRRGRSRGGRSASDQSESDQSDSGDTDDTSASQRGDNASSSEDESGAMTARSGTGDTTEGDSSAEIPPQPRPASDTQTESEESGTGEDSPGESRTQDSDTGASDQSDSEDDEDTEALQARAPRKDSPEDDASDDDDEDENGDENGDEDDDASDDDDEDDDSDDDDDDEDDEDEDEDEDEDDDEDGDKATRSTDDDEVEVVGAEDALEEVSRPPRSRLRQYKIQEVIKRRQIMLVQVVKEERGNKGAALTTYLSLAGRYCVLMPNTARGGGISRKITQVNDRKRLKEVASSLDVPEGMGLIVRTAGANRTKTEIKRDFEYLLRLWENVRDLTLRSSAPTLVYEEGNLVKRTIRDLYNKDIESIHVEGDEGYKEAKAFMRMLMPSHAKHVQPYRDRIPLFQRYQVESQLDSMFSPTVELPSGGYLVINPTEALVAIDVNSGRATKEHSIEDTALKTNLEAAEEVARQLRLRDLAGLIVIDFIDMEDYRNNRAVEKKLKDCLKNDRARIQVGKISVFGLLEMSRQRLRAGVLEGSTIVCPHCEGSGKIRSVESAALRVLRACEEEGVRERCATATVRVPKDVAVYILNQKRRQLMEIENRYGLAVQVEHGEELYASDFRLERGEPLTPERRARIQDTAISMETAYDTVEDDGEDDDYAGDDGAEENQDADQKSGDREDSQSADGDKSADDSGSDGDERPGRRRRRRRRSGSDDNTGPENGDTESREARGSESSGDSTGDSDRDTDDDTCDGAEADGADGDGESEDDRRRRRRRRGKRGGRRSRGRSDQQDDDAASAEAGTQSSDSPSQEGGSQDGGSQDGDEQPFLPTDLNPFDPHQVRDSREETATVTGSRPRYRGQDRDSRKANGEAVSTSAAGAPETPTGERDEAQQDRKAQESGQIADHGAAKDSAFEETPWPPLKDDHRAGAASHGAQSQGTQSQGASSQSVPAQPTPPGAPSLSQHLEEADGSDEAGEGVLETAGAAPEEDDDKPKRKGWWQRRFFSL